MSSSGFSKAWRWSVECSPVLNLCRRLRYMGYPNHKAFAMLEAAGLPKQADALIRKTVRKSKLWCDERAEITRELIAHTQDAIEAGRSDEEIAKTFGNPKRIAKLMRRSMKRKRPLYWRAYRNMKRATGVMIVLLVVGYGGLAAKFYMGKPSIKRNYIAELNARNDGYSEDQKAWGVYQEADFVWQRLVLEQWHHYLAQGDAGKQGRAKLSRNTFLNQASSSINESQPGDPEYLRSVGLVRAFAPELGKIREAAQRPIVGLLYTDRNESVEIEDDVFELKLLEPNADPREQDLVIGVLLPNLGITRRYANILAFDAKLAIEDGDTQRATENYLAIAGIARQNLKQEFMISKLVGMTTLDNGAVSLVEHILEQPDLWNSDQLVSIAHAYSQAGGEINLDLTYERIAFDDVLQRMYTDNGNGNGHLTSTGMELFNELNSMYSRRQRTDLAGVLLEDPTIEAVARPLALVRSADRVTEFARYSRLIERAERVLREGPQSIGWLFPSEAEIQSLRDDSSVRISVAGMMTPALGSAIQRAFIHKQTSQALSTMFAIEIYQLKHGQYPENLDQLTPQFLPTIPDDLMNPGHPIQYRLDETGYILYSAGSDGDLDNGKEPDPTDLSRTMFGSRFEMVYSYTYSITGNSSTPTVALDENGQPMMAPPRGPDSDWILIDMRRVPKAPESD